MKRESIIKGFPICVALLIFVVLTSGCVSIGPAMKIHSVKFQESEVAVIKGRYYFTFFYHDCVFIYRIDGIEVGSSTHDYLKEATKVEVLPGWHELVIVHWIMPFLGDNYFECVRAAFNFEAGHKYKIKSPFLSHLVEIIHVNTGVTIFSQTLVECDPWKW